MRPSIYLNGYATLIFPLLSASRNSFRMNTYKKREGLLLAGAGSDSEGKDESDNSAPSKLP